MNTPEICVKVTLLNFLVTSEDLADSEGRKLSDFLKIKAISRSFGVS